MCRIDICLMVSENCQNLYDSYGMSCVHCNCCGRFNPGTMLQCQLELNKRMLTEQQAFDAWGDCPEVRALQRKNIAANIKYFRRKIKKIEAQITKQSEDIEAARVDGVANP